MKNNVILRALSLAIAAVFSLNSTVFAQDANLNKLVEQMQQQMSSMQQTINAQNAKIASIEGHAGGMSVAAAPAPTAMTQKDFLSTLDDSLGNVGTSKWLKGLKFGGIFRLRFETVHFSKGSTTRSGNENRARFRLRYGFEKKFSDEIKIGFRLASGNQADATSTNQTLTGDFAAKSIQIDRAYAIYTPNWAKVGPIKNLEIGGGKFQNPFEKGTSDIIWDSDVVPEGAYESVDIGLIDQENFGLNAFATAGQLLLTETSHSVDAVIGAASSKSNAELWAFQGGLKPEFKIGDMPVKGTHAISYYDWSDIADDNNILTTGGSAKNLGTIVSGADTAASAGGFQVIDFYNAVEFQPVESLPSMKLYFDFARNTINHAPFGKGNNDDNAWAIGYKIGNAKTKGQWEASYAYKYVGVNSTPSLNDSDFGFTGRRGSVISVGYAITDYLKAGMNAFFDNNIQSDRGLANQPEKRLFWDLVWGF